MKHINHTLILLLLFIVSACSPKVITTWTQAYPALDNNEDVWVIEVDKDVPENAEILGTVKVGDTGFTTQCSYGFVLENAKSEARKYGGNAIKIIEHKLPSAMGSSCHRIRAEILRIEDIDNYKSKEDEEILLDVDYAILNIYRFNGTAPLVSYTLYLGDSIISRVRNNYKTTLHIKKEGNYTLWAKTESKDEIPINLEFGRTYYLRCSVSLGLFVGHPMLELIDNKNGKAEFESFKTD